MTVRDLVVPDGDVPLAVRLHLPDDFPRASGDHPAVVVAGSWLTVKEQMADLYAARLAQAGFVALTFDFAGFGASGGALRQTEIPTRKIRNLEAVVDWLRSQSGIDQRQLGVLAVCASAQYTLGPLARGLPVAAFVSVAGWYHDQRSVAAFYGGEDGVTERLGWAEEAMIQVENGGDVAVAAAYGPNDERAGMVMEMDYYANPDRGAVPTWRNEMNELTWAHWLTYNAFAAVPDVQVPCLFVHSDDAVLPDNVKTIASQLGNLAELDWTEGEQTDFYDRPEQVDHAVASAVRHFHTAMGKHQ